MNPNSATANRNNASLFEGSFESQEEFEKPEVINDSVTHTPETLKALSNNWVEFYSQTTEQTVTYTPDNAIAYTPENAVSRSEITETKIEYQFETPKVFELQEETPISTVEVVIEKQKGSGSWVEDTGLKLDFKGLFGFVFGGLGKNLGGALGVMFEISKDAAKAAVRKEKKAEDPKKAEAKKKADAKKKGNIRAFYEGLRAQTGPAASAEAIQAEAQEKENINKTVKLNTSYKGIKDSFGRLTKYASSMFEKAQMEQEKQVKKIEQQQKQASAGPDLNMDKAAEGGFLSSTGGQGAG